ncbi:hypothetical protein CR492_08480 [Methylocella silvestris]|uniref:Uncharacterized protein n=1 Tax=Methylocella silvestris TaxID=199596 RepID=A0A2J7TI55_METSI|nr:hypothetical protein CR492_08480 [Methylocella silvestris]
MRRIGFVRKAPGKSCNPWGGQAAARRTFPQHGTDFKLGRFPEAEPPAVAAVRRSVYLSPRWAMQRKLGAGASIAAFAELSL